jgi:uncharacterized integral membrane protein
MRIINLILKIVILCVIVIFGAFNMQTVSIKYFFGKAPIELPLFVIMILSFLVGMFITYLLFLTDRIRLKKELNRIKKSLKDKDSELLRLRNLPLVEEKNINAQE